MTVNIDFSKLHREELFRFEGEDPSPLYQVLGFECYGNGRPYRCFFNRVEVHPCGRITRETLSHVLPVQGQGTVESHGSLMEDGTRVHRTSNGFFTR